MFLKYLRPNRLVLPALAGLLTAFPLMAGAEEEHHHDHDHTEKHAEHRDLGAHEHGVAELGFAADGQDLIVEFESPAANLIGFEHMPRTAEQEKAVEDAMVFLKDGAKIFDIDANAKCTMAKADIVSPFETPKEEKHGHDHDHDHDHADKDHGDADHAEKDHADHDTHSEFVASYAFKCTSLPSLKSVQVNLFDTFPGIEEIHAVFLGDNLQFGVDLTKKNSLITLPGA